MQEWYDQQQLFKGINMRVLQKTLLISAMFALPVAMVQAQNTPPGTAPQGEMPESSKPSPNPTPPKTPSQTMPAPTGTAQGEAPYSSQPGTDKPAAKNAPDTKMHKSDMPHTGTAPANTTTGSPQQTAPSVETPPAGAPMRTGPESRSNEGAVQTQGSRAPQ